MRRKAFAVWPIAAAILAVFGLTALAQDAWDVHKASYKGSMLCKMCHQTLEEKGKAFVPGFDKTAHPKAMQKASVEGAIVGDFTTNPVFKKEQVAWVLGKGTNKQAYLDANFQVLPAMWYVKEKKWKPAQAADGAAQCIACHTTGFDPATKKFVAEGVGCEMCHGPGSDHVGGNQKAIVNPKNLDPVKKGMICGQCHSAGKDPTGKLPHPVGFRPGDDLTKTFVDAKPTAPGSNQQYSEHLQSEHAKVGTNCTTCHDPHKSVEGLKAQIRKPVNDLCLECHAGTIKDMKTHAPTAAADATCATCHMHGGVHTFKKATQ